MISTWLEGQPERIRSILDPSWSPVRAGIVLASRHEQEAVESLDDFVCSEAERTLDTLVGAGERIQILLSAVWPDGVPDGMANACPCRSEFVPGPTEHFPECAYSDSGPWSNPDPDFDTCPQGFEVPTEGVRYE